MRTLLHHRESGHLGQYEDDWFYIDEDGEQYVVHRYEHVRVNGLSKSEGETKIDVEEFLRTGHNTAATKLKEILGR